MENSLVSIVVPTYNRTDMLRLTLNSIISQSYKNLEIIVVDDGSEGDENRILCEKLSVSYVRIPNSGGPARPRNEGIKRSSGSYICFTDDDDLWLPRKVEQQIEILTNNPEYGLVHGPCEEIDEYGNKTGAIIGRPGNRDVKHGDVKLRMLGNWTLMMPTPMLRMDVVNEVGYFNEEIPPALEDVEYWVRCSFVTKFYYFDEAMVYYRSHSANISKDRKRYLPLPLYLFDVMNNAQKEERLDSSEARLLRNNLVRMQLKLLKYNPPKVLMNLSRINPFWFLNFGNIKLLAAVVFRKT